MDENQRVDLTQKDLDLIYEVSASLYSIDNLDMMLKSILYKIKEVCQVEGVSIALHDSDEKEFSYIRTAENNVGIAIDGLVKMRFPDDYGVAGWVFRERQSLMINDVYGDGRFYNTIDIQKHFVTRSMICTPIKSRKKIIGVLSVLEKNADEFIPKDIILLEIISNTIGVAIENARRFDEIRQDTFRLRQENVRLLSQIQDRFCFQEIIGSSVPMRKVFKLLEKALGSTDFLYLQGETGTGKELFARAIHYNSPLKDKPFVSGNCQVFSENLLEIELFGQIKSIFTGRNADKRGLFELAEGGTVFLDEIADIPESIQGKLLRVLQEGLVKPVGSDCYHPVNFRLIVASSHSLLKEVEKGNFQKELFYQMHLFHIMLPPLRERKDDIPFLAANFLNKFANNLNWPVPKILPEAMMLLQQFEWPGNIRELENEIERALTLAGGEKEICIEHLSQKITGAKEKIKNYSDGIAGTLKERVEQIERQMVSQAIKEAGGNRSRASRSLGLTRQGLLNKLKRYKIEEA